MSIHGAQRLLPPLPLPLRRATTARRRRRRRRASVTSSRRAGYEELDAKRESYENELEWLEQQDKENIEAGRAIQVRLRLVSPSCFLRNA